MSKLWLNAKVALVILSEISKQNRAVSPGPINSFKHYRAEPQPCPMIGCGGACRLTTVYVCFSHGPLKIRKFSNFQYHVEFIIHRQHQANACRHSWDQLVSICREISPVSEQMLGFLQTKLLIQPLTSKMKTHLSWKHFFWRPRWWVCTSLWICINILHKIIKLKNWEYCNCLFKTNLGVGGDLFSIRALFEWGERWSCIVTVKAASQ